MSTAASSSHSTAQGTPPGSWAGKSPEQRRAERRRRLLDAGLAAFGTEGYADSSINRICKTARVTERDLYREFGGKTGLLLGVYDELIDEVLAAMGAALAAAPVEPEPRVRAALDAFTSVLAADERKARVNFLEVVGVSAEVEAHRREVLRGFGSLVADEWTALTEAGRLPAGPPPGVPMALVGAAQELLVDWVTAPAGRTREQLVATIVDVYLAVMRVTGPDRSTGRAARRAQ